jgi:hypothetical protein
VEDDEGSCPRSHRTDDNIEKVRSLVHSDRWFSINRAYYVEILKRLHEAVRRRRPELWPDWVFHHDSAPAHKSLSVKQFLAQKSITELERPSVSPDLAPNDLGMFP